MIAGLELYFLASIIVEFVGLIFDEKQLVGSWKKEVALVSFLNWPRNSAIKMMLTEVLTLIFFFKLSNKKSHT